jgi:hypothetical protein
MYNIAIPNMLNGVSQQPPQVRFLTQCEELVNAYASPTESLTKRYPTEVVADFSGNGDAEGKGKLHIIDRGEGKEAYAVILKDDGITAWDLINNTSVTVNLPAGGSYSYLGGGSVDDLERDLSLTTIADYTFVCNRNVTVQMTNDTVAARNPESFVWVKTGNYGTTYTITLEALDVDGDSLGTTEISQKTFTPSETGVDNDGYLNAETNLDNEDFPAGNSVIDTRLIAAQLAVLLRSQFSAGTAFEDFSVTRTDYGLHITLDDTTGTTKSFRASVADGLGGNGLRVVDRETQSFEDLPVIAPDGMITKIVGLPEVPEDDYYVRFSSNIQTETGEGVWVETVAPGLQYKLDPVTMPHALIRKFDPVTGDPFFIFTPIDGSIASNEVFWDDRTVGDDNSNPVPSFVDGEVSSIFTFQGRLGILSGESVSVSEAGNFFNFFRTTVTTVLDSGPIDVYSAYPQITKFRHGIPLGDRLILFSNKAQMILTSPDTELLTPRTVILEPAGQYEAVADCMPAQVDQEIYFPFKRGDNYTGVRDMVVNLQDASLIAAPEVTAHVPKYINGTPKSMKASPFDRTLAVLTDQDSSTLYVYKWFDRDNERIQSSWSKWTFPGIEILSCGWYESRLVMYTFSSETGLYGLREIDLRENRVDQDSFITARLDNRRYFSDTSGGTITIPGFVDLGPPFPLAALFRFGDAPSVSSLVLNGVVEPQIINPGQTALLTKYEGPEIETTDVITQNVVEHPHLMGDFVSLAKGATLRTYLKFSATRATHNPVNRQFSMVLDTAPIELFVNLFNSDFQPQSAPNPSGPGTYYYSSFPKTVSLGGRTFQLSYNFLWVEPYDDTAPPGTVVDWSMDGYIEAYCSDVPSDSFSTFFAQLRFVTGVQSAAVFDTTFAPNSCSSQNQIINLGSVPIPYGGGNTPYSPIISGDTVVYASGPNAGQRVEEVQRSFNPATGNTTITLADTGGAPVFHGNPYEFRYTFSQPYFRVGSQNSALGSGRFQVKNINVLYDDSGPFRAEVTPKNPLLSDSYVYDRGSTVNSSFVNAPIESGTMRIPVMGTTEQFNVSLVNDTPYPSKFTSAEIEASYSGRYRRLGV